MYVSNLGPVNISSGWVFLMNNENYTQLLDWWNLQILGFTEATGAIIGQADLPWQGLPAGDPNYEVNIGFTISSSSGDFLPTNFFIAADECIIQLIESPPLNETSSPEEALGEPILGTTSDDGPSSLKIISSPPTSVTFGGPAPIGNISQPDASPSLLNALTSTSSLDLTTSSAPPVDGLNPSSLPPTFGVTPPSITMMSPPLFGLPPEITFHVSPPSSTLDASSMFTFPALSMSSLPPAYGPSITPLPIFSPLSDAVPPITSSPTLPDDDVIELGLLDVEPRCQAWFEASPWWPTGSGPTSALNIYVRNIGDTAVPAGWIFSMSNLHYNGVATGPLWNLEILGFSSGNFTARATQPWEILQAAGQAVNMGFMLASASAEFVPDVFTLNGEECKILNT